MADQKIRASLQGCQAALQQTPSFSVEDSKVHVPIFESCIALLRLLQVRASVIESSNDKKDTDSSPPAESSPRAESSLLSLPRTALVQLIADVVAIRTSNPEYDVSLICKAFMSSERSESRISTNNLNKYLTDRSRTIKDIFTTLDEEKRNAERDLLESEIREAVTRTDEINRNIKKFEAEAKSKAESMDAEILQKRLALEKNRADVLSHVKLYYVDAKSEGSEMPLWKQKLVEWNKPEPKVEPHEPPKKQTAPQPETSKDATGPTTVPDAALPASGSPASKSNTDASPSKTGKSQQSGSNATITHAVQPKVQEPVHEEIVRHDSSRDVIDRTPARPKKKTGFSLFSCMGCGSAVTADLDEPDPIQRPNNKRP